MVPIRPRPGRVARPVLRRLPRRAIPWWLATAVLAGATGLVADGLLQRASEAEARWGSTRTVLVATGAIAPGDPLAGATVVRRLPAVAVPADAITRVEPGGVAVEAIGDGEVVTSTRVGGPAAAGVAGRLPRGIRAVVVPLEVGGLPVRTGDRVDLLASASPDAVLDAPTASSPSAPIARGALVVAVRSEGLVVAVDAADSVAVAAALGRGPLVPALVSAAEG